MSGIGINYDKFFEMAVKLMGRENITEDSNVKDKVNICNIFEEANRTKETYDAEEVQGSKEEILDSYEISEARDILQITYNRLIAKGDKPKMGQIDFVKGENDELEFQVNEYVITQDIIDNTTDPADFDKYTIPDNLKDAYEKKKAELTGDKSATWVASDRGNAKVGYKDTTGRIGASAWKNSISNLFGDGKLNLNNFSTASEVLDAILNLDAYKGVSLDNDGKAKLLQDFIHNNKSVFNTDGQIHQGAVASKLELPSPENLLKAQYNDANTVKAKQKEEADTQKYGGENSIVGPRPQKRTNLRTVVDPRDEDNTAPKSRLFSSKSFELNSENKLSPDAKAEVIKLIQEGKITSYTRTINNRTQKFEVKLVNGKPCMKLVSSQSYTGLDKNKWTIIQNDRTFADMGKSHYERLERNSSSPEMKPREQVDYLQKDYSQKSSIYDATGVKPHEKQVGNGKHYKITVPQNTDLKISETYGHGLHQLKRGAKDKLKDQIISGYKEITFRGHTYNLFIKNNEIYYKNEKGRECQASTEDLITFGSIIEQFGFQAAKPRQMLQGANPTEGISGKRGPLADA